jgi:hypothetical protein
MSSYHSQPVSLYLLQYHHLWSNRIVIGRLLCKCAHLRFRAWQGYGFALGKERVSYLELAVQFNEIDCPLVAI